MERFLISPFFLIIGGTAVVEKVGDGHYQNIMFDVVIIRPAVPSLVSGTSGFQRTRKIGQKRKIVKGEGRQDTLAADHSRSINFTSLK